MSHDDAAAAVVVTLTPNVRQGWPVVVRLHTVGRVGLGVLLYLARMRMDTSDLERGSEAYARDELLIPAALPTM